MTAEEFIEKVRALKPNREEFKNYIDPLLIDIFLEGYDFRKIRDTSDYNDTLLQVCQCYDTGSTYANLSLGNEVVAAEDEDLDEGFYKIGSLEADVLILLKETKELAIFSYAAGYIITHYVAENSTNFLEAYLLLLDEAPFYMVKGEKQRDLKKQQIEKCVAVSGGERYRSFYEWYYAYWLINT